MKLSKLIGERFKEKPADATIISQILLIRGGYIKHVCNGIFTLLMPAKRIISKIENIVREEMDKIDGQEVLMPVVLPKELWEESGRYNQVGSELLRFKDRGNKDLLLAMTHEEAAVHLVRDSVNSYSKLPIMLYQIQTKFRDEARTKGGLIRVREFTMKDAYSFHTSLEDLIEYYQKCYDSYFKIFSRIGIPEVIAVGSDSGMMGGTAAHEFMLISDAGEDRLAICDSCDYKDNIEVAYANIINKPDNDTDLTLIETPGVTDIDSLVKFTSCNAEKMIKACVFAIADSDEIAVVFIRADYDVNETKLKKVLKQNIFALENTEGIDLEFGYIGPANLKTSDKIKVFYDVSIKDTKNMMSGANKKGYHYKGISVGRDFTPSSYHNLYETKSGDICSECGGKIAIKKGIEVGNIFQLGTKYTSSMDMSYLDENGKRQTPIMGCYGIGIGRAMASVVESRHDEKGPIWPFLIAPWHVHICVLNGSEQMYQDAENLYNSLINKNIEVIIDDRKLSAGVQFSDADLLGVPYRVIFGKKNYENNNVEIASRDKSYNSLASLDKLEQTILELIGLEKSKL